MLFYSHFLCFATILDCYSIATFFVLPPFWIVHPPSPRTANSSIVTCETNSRCDLVESCFKSRHVPWAISISGECPVNFAFAFFSIFKVFCSILLKSLTLETQRTKEPPLASHCYRAFKMSHNYVRLEPVRSGIIAVSTGKHSYTTKTWWVEGVAENDFLNVDGLNGWMVSEHVILQFIQVRAFSVWSQNI